MTVIINPDEEMMMLDLETRSTDIQNGSIAQIGAIKFTLNGGIIDEFSINLKHDPRFDISESTMKEFWAKQPQEVRESVFGNQVHFEEALREFDNWIGKKWFYKIVWSHGKEFDICMLNNYFKVAGILWPFNHPRTLDTRTIFAVAGINTYSNSHNALEDCRNQIKLLQDALC